MSAPDLFRQIRADLDQADRLAVDWIRQVAEVDLDELDGLLSDARERIADLRGVIAHQTRTTTSQETNR